MAGPLIECVPNFSEGRDRATLQAIEKAIVSVPGVWLLRSEMDPDHNRSVITFAGPPEQVSESALRAITLAVERIDLRRHSGVHPRLGAADVVPFAPLEGATLAQCVEIAHRTGEQVWKRLGVPVYCYEAAASTPERAPLENCRRGGFENPKLPPDLGGPALHPSAGACILGARRLLIAFNVNLKTSDLSVATAIARKIRASSGGMPFVKAMGVTLRSRGVVQVSCNLTDFEQTSVHQVFDAVRAEALARAVEIAGTQIVGLIPRKALQAAANHYLQLEPAEGSLVLEDRLADARAASDCVALLADLARPRSPHAGGSAAAAAGAMAAALGSKLSRIAKLPDHFAEPLAFFTEAIQRDAAAFEATRQQGAPALEHATLVPIEIAERAQLLNQSLEAIDLPARLAPDRETALQLAQAARKSAIAVARANLAGIPPDDRRSRLEARLRAIE